MLDVGSLAEFIFRHKKKLQGKLITIDDVSAELHKGK